MERAAYSAALACLLLIADPMHAQMPYLAPVPRSFPLQLSVATALPVRPALPPLLRRLPLEGTWVPLERLFRPEDDGRFLMPFKLSARPTIIRNGWFGAPRRYGPHRGIDLAVPVGTPVYASRPGTVVHFHRFDPREDQGKGYGGIVIVAHEDGSQSLYCHLSRISVRVNQTVTRETRLGLTGGKDNGDSQGPHLHFMIISRDGRRLDPAIALGLKPRHAARRPKRHPRH